MKKLLLAISFVVLGLYANAQKPNWIKIKPTPTNDTYLYVVESATGKTEMAARNSAIAEVLRSTALRLGMPFESEAISKALQNGIDYSVISRQYNIPINKVCEYSEYDDYQYRVYILCQVAKAGNIQVYFDDFNQCYDGKVGLSGKDALYSYGVKIYKNGRELEEYEIRTLFANSKSYDLYDKGVRQVNMDFDGLHLIALPLALAGPITFGLSFADLHNNQMTTRWIGLGLIGGCATCFIIEACIQKSGKNKIRKAVNLYNNGKMYSEANLEFGFTGNGVCLTLNF